MNARHLQEARLLQGLGLKSLRDGEAQIKDAGMAGKLVETGVKIERTIRGEPTERQDIEVTFRIEETDVKNKMKSKVKKRG